MGHPAGWAGLLRMLRLWRRPPTLGRRGERVAADHLKRGGYRVLATNARNRAGELDLVARDPDGRTLVIVEVKSGVAGPIAPEVHVNRDKRRRLVALAAQFARRHRQTDCPIRFDVVAVVFDDPAPPVVRHHRAAFASHV